jgi:uncharacterized membrane protein (UPF0127 family)
MPRLSIVAAVLTAVLGCNPPRLAAGPGVGATPEAAPTASVAPSARPQASCEPTTSRAHVLLGDRKVPVDLAFTPESRTKGLSGRPCLARGTGLVLGWDVPTPAQIWMPDMNFAIDVVFVRGEQVVAVYADAQPCVRGRPCPTFGPDVPVDYVLEVPAGSCAEWGLKAGGTIRLVR